MAQNECGCTENNCPHKTSEVTLFDGNLTSISVPSGSSLNDVLALLESYINTTSVCNDVNYTLGAYSACLDLAAGTYSFTQIMDAMISAMCANASSIAEIEIAITELESTPSIGTSAVFVEELVLPTCFGDFSGITSTDLFNTIMEKICDLCGIVGPRIGDTITLTVADPGADTDLDGTNALAANKNARIEHVAEAFKSFIDNDSFIYEHTMPTTSVTSFTVELQLMRGIVEYYLVIRKSTENMTVNATMDTYFFLSGDGTILRREVAVGAPAPASPTFSHNLYKVTSDGAGVASVTSLYTSSGLNPIPIAPGDVSTASITDAAVTTIKINPVTTGATYGHASLIEFTNNDQGQVTSASSNMLLSGLSNGDILIYNSGLNRWENGDNTAVNTLGYIPKVNATSDNYTDSSLLENTDQIESSIKIEINAGVAENDSDAILNLVGNPILMPRMTAADATLLPLTNGYLIYATTTDLTFTSVGFWGVEAGAWVKL